MIGEKPLKQEEDWEAQKLALSYSKNAVRRAKRDSWHSFVESLNSQTPTTWLVKIIRRNATVRVSKGPRQLTATNLPRTKKRRLAEKGNHKYIFLSPKPSCPNPHFATKSLWQNRWLAVSLFAISLLRSVDLARFSNVIKHNGKFTKSPRETFWARWLWDSKIFLWSPFSANRRFLVRGQFVAVSCRGSIASRQKITQPGRLCGQSINETWRHWNDCEAYVHLSAWKQLLSNFNHSKYQGQTGSILYCYRKFRINRKDITTSFFKHAWDTAMCHWHGKKAQVYFPLNPERKVTLKLNTSVWSL